MWKKIKSNIVLIVIVVGIALVSSLFMLPLHESLAGPGPVMHTSHISTN